MSVSPNPSSLPLTTFPVEILLEIPATITFWLALDPAVAVAMWVIGPRALYNSNLTCYACSSSHESDACDSRRLRNAADEEAIGLQKTCPDAYLDYCYVKSTVFRDGEAHVERGCAAETGRSGIVLLEGCHSYVDGDKSVSTCFCPKNLCNNGRGRLGGSVGVLGLAMGSLMVKMLNVW